MSESQLRPIIENMNPARAEEIRQAYFDAVSGLQNLVTALEVADAECSTPEIDLLLNEHLLAVQALDVMNRSQLGKAL